MHVKHTIELVTGRAAHTRFGWVFFSLLFSQCFLVGAHLPLCTSQGLGLHLLHADRAGPVFGDAALRGEGNGPNRRYRLELAPFRAVPMLRFCRRWLSIPKC